MKEFKISKQITNRETGSVNKYLQEISKMEMVTPDEEAELALRVRQGDPLALEKLTKANLRFVVSVAKKYQNSGIPLGDLINEGNLGLIKAAKKFDETRGFKFISYAVWWIRQAIIQSLTSHSRMVRLPLNKVNDSYKIQKYFSGLEQKYERDPTVNELSDATGISSDIVEHNQRYPGWHLSLDTPFHDGDGISLLDVIPDSGSSDPDRPLLKNSLQMDIRGILSKLDSRERSILVSYYGLDGQPSATLNELSRQYNMTTERVRQIKEKALLRLKGMRGSEILRSHLQ
ncbi:sigma-70 family RNA polymerase sigma factor [Ravibacter arvi]|uniref:Sigma-70 family RNA polymerase sigma factor n=1 Tax=Ravibacter arvi TaxID=2051041 RepID=A0ABP8LL87_9BACT